MNKKTIIRLNVVSIIFSLIITILFYFGIIRYLFIRNCNDPTKYINDYNKITKSDHYTVISLTTTYDRINKIMPVIVSILNQTVRVDKIYLFIKYPDNHEKNIEIPTYLSKVVILNKFGCNYKDLGAIIPCLLLEEDKNTIIITIKDNIIYGTDFIEQILNKNQENPDKILILANKGKIDAMLFKPDFFGINIIEFNNEDTKTWIEKNKINKIKYIKYNEYFYI